MKLRLTMLPLALLISGVAPAQTPIPAAGLCNTGLTPASPLSLGCTTSVLVTPVNPETGGTSVDGNWQLATPYPSASYTAQAPNVCSIQTFGPAWIDAPFNPITTPNGGGTNWYTPPADVSSQWITPEVITPSNAGGWYVYRTQFPVPAETPGFSGYLLTVSGRVLIDDLPGGIFLGTGRGCQWLGMSPFQGLHAADSEWHSFAFAAAVEPNSEPYLYFLTYNINQANGNPNGLRVEFVSAHFSPIP